MQSYRSAELSPAVPVGVVLLIGYSAINFVYNGLWALKNAATNSGWSPLILGC